MDKNTIWAFILILAVFWISSELFWKQNTALSAPETPAAEEAVSGSAAEPVRSPQPEPEKETKPLEDQELYQETESSLALEDNIILENEKIRLSFSNHGARINSIILKNYYMPDKETRVDLVRTDGNLLELEFADIAGNQISGIPRMFNWERPSEDVLIFSATGSFGTIEKEFRLVDDYHLLMDLKVKSNRDQYDYIFKFDDGIADTERYLKRKNQNYQIIMQSDNKIERLTLQKLSKNQEVSGVIDWAAIRSKFFVIGIVKDELTQLYKVFGYSNQDSPALRLHGRSTRALLDSQFKLYMGPVISDQMEKLGSNFGAAYYAGNGIFFGQGFIKPISRLFSWIFRQFHQVIPNWGLCLILFSILIKIVLYPLTHKSFESSTKLQKIQPQITELREKYKSDPQKMNQEMQRIYREKGVSPLGGCLPMLLQMPIFFALYPVIRYSIDLRQAGFLWLRDLSEPDPYLILPIMMAVFMFLQQYMMQPHKSTLEKMTDQQKAQMQSQKMMMYIMPAIMFFLFKSFPGGLVLYWTIFNVMSMLQQSMIKKKFS